MEGTKARQWGGIRRFFADIPTEMAVSESVNCLCVLESFAVLARVLGITVMASIIVVIVKANVLASLFQSKDRDLYNKPCLWLALFLELLARDIQLYNILFL
jgi:hypothetical protein